MPRSAEELKKSKAYMRYALAFLSAKPEILQELQIHSIDDLYLERTFQGLPVVSGKNNSGEKISAKTLSDAFSLKSAPTDTTLEVIQKQFEIELSFRQFKQKLKENDTTFVAYYEAGPAESNRLREKTENETENSPQTDKTKNDEVTSKPTGLRNWFAENKLALLIPTTTLIIVVIMLTKQDSKQESVNPIKEDFEKKQVETVLALYEKLKGYSVEIKFILMNRYSITTNWLKDSTDSFYESQVREIPLLHMRELLENDFKKRKVMSQYFLPNKSYIRARDSDIRVVDTFENFLLIESPVTLDYTLDIEPTVTNKRDFIDVAFSSRDIIDNEIANYARSLLLPDSIRSWLTMLENYKRDLQSLNKILAERRSEIIILGTKRTIPTNCTRLTDLYVWYDPSSPSTRIDLHEISYITEGLENSILRFLESKGISVT